MSGYCFYSQDALALAQAAGVDVIINEYAEKNKNRHMFFVVPCQMRM